MNYSKNSIITIYPKNEENAYDNFVTEDRVLDKTLHFPFNLNAKKLLEREANRMTSKGTKDILRLFFSDGVCALIFKGNDEVTLDYTIEDSAKDMFSLIPGVTFNSVTDAIRASVLKTVSENNCSNAIVYVYNLIEGSVQISDPVDLTEQADNWLNNIELHSETDSVSDEKGPTCTKICICINDRDTYCYPLVNELNVVRYFFRKSPDGCFNLIDFPSSQNTTQNWREISNYINKTEKKLINLPVHIDIFQDKYLKEITSSIQESRIEEAFLKIVSLYPKKIAIKMGEETATYEELNNISEQIAEEIRAHKVVGRKVVIKLPRSIVLIAAIIGVLKSGNTYVPVDIHSAVERNKIIEEDSNAFLIISSESNDNCNYSSKLNVLNQTLLFQKTNNDCLEECANKDIAYIIYTSGSTGKPKGVQIPHANLLSLLNATIPLYELDSGDKWTLFHSIAFDFSVWEMWGALLTGATLIVVPYLTSRDPVEFARLLMEENVTVLNQTPTAFLQLSSYMCPNKLQHCLRLVIFGGEFLPKKELIKWFDVYPEKRCKLVNMYGITETTVHVTYKEVTRLQALKKDKSVGIALNGWEVSIRDKAGEKLPQGVPGEICVSGKGVALGYLNQPTLTNEKFVDIDGVRTYRSGDLGRINDKGELEHLGRIDSQVKLRGFRIECGEISNIISGYKNVTKSVVILDKEGEVLRAFIQSATDIDISDLRKYLSRKLPDYMVPSSFTIISDIPYNNNGKLDTKKLMQAYQEFESQNKSKKMDLLERKGDFLDSNAAIYRQVWEDILNTPISLNDNFFEQGGSSLSAIKINTKLRAMGVKEIPIRYFYVYQTLEKIINEM